MNCATQVVHGLKLDTAAPTVRSFEHVIS